MSARGNAARSKSGGRNRAKGSSSASLPFLEAPSPIASLPPSEDSLGERALGDEENSELGDGASVASSVGFAEDAVTPASATRKKRARIDSSMSMEQTTPAAVPATEERSSTGGDQSTKIRIPYSKLRGSGVIGSPLFQSSDAVGAVATPAAVASDGSTTKLRIVYSRPGQTPERSGTMRMDFPELADFPATTRALSAVAKGDQYGTVAKREADLLRDEMERMRNELRNFDLEVRRELDLMAETRAAPGLPDPRASPALQRRRTEDVKPTIRQQSAPAAVFVDPNKKRLKKLSSRGREEDEEESIDVTDPDAKAKAKRDQRKREKEALEAANAAGGESKKYNLKARAKDKKSKGKKGEEEDGEADSQDDAESLDAANLPSTAGGPSNPFWAFVHQFIRDFVEEDLLLLQPRQLSASDPAFLVPPLGRHWTEFRKPKSEDQEGPGEGEGEAQPIYCGDLTQRILASLIEDRLLPDDPLLALNGVIPVASTSVAPGATPSAAPAAAAPTPAPAASTPASGGAPQQFDSSAFEFAEAEAALPLSAPPVGDYSFATMLSLEERIKMELKAMGLFDPEENPVNVSQEKEEDNEIVQEIKVLQNQLREQVAKNNASRERILELAVARMADQKRDRDVRGAHAELEKAYIRVQQRRKPKRKKGGRKGS